MMSGPKSSTMMWETDKVRQKMIQAVAANGGPTS